MLLRIPLLLLLTFSGATFAKPSHLVHCPVGLPHILNPGMSFNANTIVGSSHLFNSLMRNNQTGGKILPALATEWMVSKNGKQVTLELRKNVWFHTTKYFKPTRPFNADDVIFTFDRMGNKKNKFHKANDGQFVYYNSVGMGELIDHVEKVSDFKIKFHLKRIHAPFLSNLAKKNLPILSKEYAESLLASGKINDIDFKPIGTGPFKLSSFRADQALKYVRHDKYFDGPAKIKKLILLPVAEASVRLQKLKTGECNVVDQPHANDASEISKASNTQLIRATKGNIGYLAMNTLKRPFDDVRVRKAVELALNKDLYINSIYKNMATPAASPLSSMPGFEKKDSQTQNIEKAKKLLAEAGLAQGFKTELWTMPVDRPYITNGKKLGELMQNDLKKIGIFVKLVTFDWPTYLKKTEAGEHSMAMLGWMNSDGDPDLYLTANLSCGAMKKYNIPRWCRPKFDHLLEKARVELDTMKRRDYYKQAMVIFQQETPWVSLAHGHYYIGVSKKLSGVGYSEFGELNFAKAHWQ